MAAAAGIRDSHGKERESSVLHSIPTAPATADSMLRNAGRILRTVEQFYITPKFDGQLPLLGAASFATRAESRDLSQTPRSGFLANVPSTAKVLGIAGVIPFIAFSPAVAGALPLPADLVQNAALLQLGYGASIASFLGGVHWGMAMGEYGGHVASWAASKERYLWSVTPSLLAWPIITLPAGPGSFIMALVFGGIYSVDRAFARKGLLGPSWYMDLRLPLTLGAVSGLAVTTVTCFAADVDAAQDSEQRQARTQMK